MTLHELLTALQAMVLDLEEVASLLREEVDSEACHKELVSAARYVAWPDDPTSRADDLDRFRRALAAFDDLEV